MADIKRIALPSGGGDCPGLNAVIRAVTKAAINEYGYEVIGYVYGYRGLYNNDYIELTVDKVENIYKEGGTILSTLLSLNNLFSFSSLRSFSSLVKCFLLTSVNFGFLPILSPLWIFLGNFLKRKLPPTVPI